MRARALVACTFASAAVVIACSGAAPSDLFGTPEASISGTEPEPTGEGTGSAGEDKLSGSSTSSGSTSSSSASSSSSSSGATSSGSSGTSGTVDSGPPPWKSPGIKCGDAYCTTNAMFCCARFDGGDPTFECRTSGCQRGAVLRCDDQSDCANGQVCCGAFDQEVGYRYSTCAPTCQQIPGFTPVRFCDPAAPTDECASIGKTCQPSTGLPGYAYCR